MTNVTYDVHQGQYMDQNYIIDDQNVASYPQSHDLVFVPIENEQILIQPMEDGISLVPSSFVIDQNQPIYIDVPIDHQEIIGDYI